MTALGIELQIPALYRALTEPAERIAVEHAALDCRMLETVLALAFAEFADGRTVAVFLPREGRAKYLLATWLADSGFKSKSFSTSADGVACASWRTPDGAAIWVVSGLCFRRDVLPFTALDRIFVVGADELQADPTELFGDVPSLVAGVFADRSQWFYEHARREGVVLHRFDADRIAACFPDQSSKGVPSTDARFRRLMRLEDVQPDYGSADFVEFAGSRLKVRPDELAALSRRQREEAATQYGQPIVSMDLLPLQRLYLQRKRDAVAAGKKPWFLLLKYRRGGFTTFEQGQNYHRAVTHPRSHIMTLADTREKANEIFRISTLFYECDPERPRRVNDAVTSMQFANGSICSVGTAGSGAVTRGLTLQRFHGSEVAFWCQGPRQTELIDNLIAGVLGATRHGEVVLETTPNGKDWFYDCYQKAKRGENEFTPVFFRWFDDPLNRAAPGTFNPQELLDTLTDAERELVALHKLDLAQIAWRRTKRREAGRMFVQEYPEDDESCFISGGVCYFNLDVLLDLSRVLAAPVAGSSAPTRREWPGGYEVRWKQPERGRVYVAGADTSEGLPECDRSGVAVLDKETGEQVAALHGHFNPRVLAEHIVRICRDYNDAMVGIERENHGHAVLQRVIELGYSRPHFRGGPLYHFHQTEDINKARPGWSTNAETRPVMLEDLAEAIESGAMKVRDPELVHECMDFKMQPNGKFEADPKSHDDAVVKWAIAWQMRKHRRPTPRITFSE